MKRLTKLAFIAGAALLYAALINLSVPIGLAAMGLWSFCYVYDSNFRRKFTWTD